MEKITVSANIMAPVDLVWEKWTNPKHIVNWNFASDEWHTPSASNDLREGGSFTSRMEAKDGSMGFDFAGVYSKVIPLQTIAYSMEDGRTVQIQFEENSGITTVTETFDAESTNPVEMQRMGWQAILDNFKRYAEL